MLPFFLIPLLASLVLQAEPDVKKPVVKYSAPFALKLSSNDASLNGRYLFTGNSGSGTKNLYVDGKNYKPNASNKFYFKVAGGTYADAVYGPPGLVVWQYKIGNTVEWHPLDFYYSPTSDLAIPGFNIAYPGLYFYFKNNKLVLKYNNKGKIVELSRFWICDLEPGNNNDYRDKSLTWKLGRGEPDNRSCKAVSVKRVWVKK